eukprot:5909586-Karenia_brevis.AAC.1
MLGGANEPFENLFEGMAYHGEGVNEDGVKTTPRLHINGADVPFYHIHRWGNDFLNAYSHDEFVEEAKSYDAVALIKQMCKYRKYTVEEQE